MRMPPLLGALLLSLGLAGAACVRNPFAATPEPLRDGRPVEFLIGGWNIDGAYNHPDWLVQVDEAGFDYVQNMTNQVDPRDGRILVHQLDSLRVARPGFRLRAVLWATHGDATTAPYSSAKDVSPAVLQRFEQKTLGPGGGFTGPSVLGYAIGDEPCTVEEMDRFGTVARHIVRSPRAKNRLAFVNLFPIAGPNGSCYETAFRRKGQDMQTGYASYLDAWLSQFDDLPAPAPLLSFDHYPFHNMAQPRSDYPDNLSIASRRALAYGRPGVRVPLWVVIYTGAHRQGPTPLPRNPTVRHTRWQAWMALAYGAKGISYWSIFPTGRPEGPRYELGGWDERGRPGEAVAGLRTLNAEMHALGPWLMRLDPVATFQGDKKRADGLVPDPHSEVAAFHRPIRHATSANGLPDLLVGLLREAGTDDDWLLVVNTHLEQKRSFRLELAAPADTIERIDGQTGRRVRVATNTTRLDVVDLPPVTGTLFRVKDRMLEPIPGVLEVRESGAVRRYRTEDGILAVDRSTGWRWRAPRMEGNPVGDAAATAAGVMRR